MSKLRAIIPEDGWAMVEDELMVYFVHPPFRKSERLPVSEDTLARAVSIHGYQIEPDPQDEDWDKVIERICKAMIASHKDEELPTSEELLDRLNRALRSGSVE